MFQDEMIPSSPSPSGPIGQPGLQCLPDELLDVLFVQLGVGEATVLACVSRTLNSAYKRFKQRRVQRLRHRFHLGAVVPVDVELGEHDRWEPHGNRWAMRDGTVALVPYRKKQVDHDSLVVVRLWDGCASSTYPLDGTYINNSFSVSEGGGMVSLQTHVRQATYLGAGRYIVSMVFQVDRSGLRLLSTTKCIDKSMWDAREEPLPAPQFVGSQLLWVLRDTDTRSFLPHYDICLCSSPPQCAVNHDESSVCRESHRVARVLHLSHMDNDEALHLMLCTVRIIRTQGAAMSTGNMDTALRKLFGPYVQQKSTNSSKVSLIVAGSMHSLLLQRHNDDTQSPERGASDIEARALVLTPSSNRVEPIWTSSLVPSRIHTAVLLSNESVTAVAHWERGPVTFLRTRDGAVVGGNFPGDSRGVLPALAVSNTSNLLIGQLPSSSNQGSGLQLYDMYSGEVCGEVPVLSPGFPSAVCDDSVVCYISAGKLYVVFL